MRTKEIIEHYQLLPHPEGGYFKEVYRSNEIVLKNNLPDRYNGSCSYYTSIYFLLESGNFSAFHRIQSDEIWHFYDGDRLEIFEIDENSNLIKTDLGRDFSKNETFQYCVKAGRWFASRVHNSGKFSFVGCSVAPGFEFADFEMADRKNLLEEYPHLKKEILELTRI